MKAVGVGWVKVHILQDATSASYTVARRTSEHGKHLIDGDRAMALLHLLVCLLRAKPIFWVRII